MEVKKIKGFSKLSRKEKIGFLSETIMDNELYADLNRFIIHDESLQKRFESFSENTLSNYHLPYGLIPNVLIDGELYHVPAVIEESSVVAAAAKSASFWADRGGFVCEAISTLKLGHVHFTTDASYENLSQAWNVLEKEFHSSIKALLLTMEKRGGGVKKFVLKHLKEVSHDFFQLELQAQTIDSMGANFINTILEELARTLPDLLKKHVGAAKTEVVMAILSNYTPECIVRMKLESPLSRMTWDKDMDGSKFSQKMLMAWKVAHYDTYRAVTHNKGIYNGIDAVVLATGNDFRATEAAGHAYAARSGKYRSLSWIEIDERSFKMYLEVPIAVGTVGGLTNLHPLAAKSLEILNAPDAKTLMKIAASVGLANNFAAMASLVTTGIQKGHMKMHLQNILNALDVNSEKHRNQVVAWFKDKTVSVAAVKLFIDKLEHER